jgi:hypothetical protein
MSDTDKYYAEIVVESSVLSEAIKSILKLATPYTGSVNFSVTKDKIVIESRAELSIIIIELPFVSCSLSHDKITFSLVLDQLRIATTSRKGNIKLVYDNSKFIIAASRYRSELMTTDYVEYPAPVSLKDANVLKITAAQSKWLFDIINSVALKPTAISPIMPVNVHINKASTIVACYARDHIVFIKDDALTGNLDFAIPVEAFAAIFSVFKDSEFTLTSTESYLKAENNNIVAYTSLPATDAYMSNEILLPRIDAFLQCNETELKIPYKELAAFFSNTRAVATAERAEIAIKANSKKTLLECNSVNGSIKASFEGCVGQECDIKLDAEYFQEAISKSNKDQEVIIKCNQEQGFILLPLKNNAYSVIALNS